MNILLQQGLEDGQALMDFHLPLVDHNLDSRTYIYEIHIAILWLGRPSRRP